jgi:hypothetical protein
LVGGGVVVGALIGGRGNLLVGGDPLPQAIPLSAALPSLIPRVAFAGGSASLATHMVSDGRFNKVSATETSTEVPLKQGISEVFSRTLSISSASLASIDRIAMVQGDSDGADEGTMDVDG